jgi:hypothetical protein
MDDAAVASVVERSLAGETQASRRARALLPRDYEPGSSTADARLIVVTQSSLGAVTLLPVLLTVCWLVGTVALLDIPISVTTALVGSISVGLGVDYAVHVTDRFGHELEAGLAPALALRARHGPSRAARHEASAAVGDD